MPLSTHFERFISICQRTGSSLPFFPSDSRNSFIFFSSIQVKVQTWPFKIKKPIVVILVSTFIFHLVSGATHFQSSDKKTCAHIFVSNGRKKCHTLASVRKYLPRRNNLSQKRQSDGVLFDGIEFICWPFVCRAQSKKPKWWISMVTGRKVKRTASLLPFKFKWMNIWNMSQYKFAK